MAICVLADWLENTEKIIQGQRQNLQSQLFIHVSNGKEEVLNGLCAIFIRYSNEQEIKVESVANVSSFYLDSREYFINEMKRISLFFVLGRKTVGHPCELHHIDSL